MNILELAKPCEAPKGGIDPPNTGQKGVVFAIQRPKNENNPEKSEARFRLFRKRKRLPYLEYVLNSNVLLIDAVLIGMVSLIPVGLALSS